MCSFNCHFSPNYERFIDFDFPTNEIVIKETATDEVIFRIPSGMLKINLTGRHKTEQ